MAMTILNNSAAMMTLGELNKNITKVGKSLSRVATGQKIVNSGDNASDYGISESMRAKIRSLEQDVKNVQNGSSLLKTALGGIQSIVDELRELKELAIDAANDSNTDADRAAMQKVLKQKQANIDNIATSTTFNTKSMLDSTYESPHWEEKYLMKYDHLTDGTTLTIDRDKEVIKYLTLDRGEDVTGLKSKSINNETISVVETMNEVIGLASAFEAQHNSIKFLDGTTSVETKDTALYSTKPQNIRDESTGYITPNRNFIRSTGGAPIAVKIDFSGAKVKETGETIFDQNGNIGSYGISQLDGQGFSLLFSDSSRNVTIKFDANNSATLLNLHWNRYQAEGQDNNNDDANSGDLEYTVGLAGFIEGTEIKSKDEFTAYVFDSIRECYDRRNYAQNRNYKYNLQDGAGCTTWKDEPSGTNLIDDDDIGKNSFILSQKHNLRMSKGEDGNYYLTAYQRYSHSLSILDEGWIGRSVENESDEWWKFKILSQESEDTYRVASVREKYVYKEFEGNPLWIQHGTRAGQHTNLYINDMRNSALGIDVADVTTKDRAVASIDYVDVAIEYALNEATNIGAYLARMEYTEANLTAENENVQAAESTMRDADMAKEMTEYTKNNVLSQAAQSMLAQANQSMSGVLSLLQ